MWEYYTNNSDPLTQVFSDQVLHTVMTGENVFKMFLISFNINVITETKHSPHLSESVLDV